ELFGTNRLRQRLQTVSEQIAHRLGVRRQLVFVALGVAKQSVVHRVGFQFHLSFDVVHRRRDCYTTGTCKEAGFLEKTWNELAGKLASCKKHETNLQGSRLPAKNTERTCGEAGFLQKTWHEFAGKPASCKKHGTNLRGSQLPAKNTERICK